MKAARVKAFQRSQAVRQAVRLQILEVHRLARPDANLVDWEALVKRFRHYESSVVQEGWAHEIPAEADADFLWGESSFRERLTPSIVNCESGECGYCHGEQTPSRAWADTDSDEDAKVPEETGAKDPKAKLRQPRALSRVDMPCHKFRVGRCRWGDKCRFVH